jgi:hypothetical protein
MNDENRTQNDSGQVNNSKSKKENTSSGALYGLGLIGAAVYFISTATSFWTGVYGILKALVWPAFLVYYALSAMGV